MITNVGKAIYATAFGMYSSNTWIEGQKNCGGTTTRCNVTQGKIGLFDKPGKYGNGNSSMIVGSGSTEPQESDYALENILSLSLSSPTITRTPTSAIYTGIWTNNTSEDVDINEVGIVYGEGDVIANLFLTIRNVLEQTITLAPGESVTLSVEINF